jgi:hypothetical protein
VVVARIFLVGTISGGSGQYVITIGGASKGSLPAFLGTVPIQPIMTHVNASQHVYGYMNAASLETRLLSASTGVQFTADITSFYLHFQVIYIAT